MSQRKKIPVMFCYDKNYVIPAAVAFYSLMKNTSKEYDYIFYTLHSDISEEQKNKLRETVKEFKNCKLEFINMEHKLDNFWKENYKGGHFSKEVMYKLLVASIFPKLDKIIVSDVDVVFLNDISKSYFELTDKDDAYIAGVQPIGKISQYLENYRPKWSDEEVSKMGNVCGGYLVMNLKKIRKDKMEQVFLDSLDKNGYRLNQMEQDIFNITCYGKIKHLHLKYVACSYMWDYYKTDEDKENDEAMNEPVQLHYATSIKPWKNVDCTKSDIWFKYIVKTPFLNQYLKELPEKICIYEPQINKIKFIDRIRNFFDKRSNNKILRIIRKIIRTIKNILLHPSKLFDKYFYKRIFRKVFKQKYTVIILDDMFPDSKSPFRYEEYTTYLKEFQNTYVVTTGLSLLCNDDKIYNNITLENLINAFTKSNPNFNNKILNVSMKYRDENLKKISNLRNSIAIITFSQNVINPIYDNLSFLEKNNIPFIFTLYPGGGFILNDYESDEKLRKIFSSKCFRKVIVTQDITKRYLIENKFCDEDKIENIFGIVTPKEMLKTNSNGKKIFGINKSTLDICFVAHKYSVQGKDKGYDLFIESCKNISKKHKNVRFHVVGGFSKNDIDISEIKDKIKFYGILDTLKLRQLYKNMDVMISPTRPFILSKGSFDGFPTGSSTEAMLNKVLLITTDELNLNNNRFKNDKDIIITKPNVKNIVKVINDLYNNPKKIKRIASSGNKKVRSIYSFKNQMNPRIRLIRNEANKK